MPSAYNFPVVSEAAQLLDFIPRGSVYRPSLINTLIALADRVQFVPQSLFVEDIVIESDYAVFLSGSFGGAKQAKWKGKDVALKTPQYSIHLTDQRHSYYVSLSLNESVFDADTGTSISAEAMPRR